MGLTLKHEGRNKIGELMLIHLCSLCDKISINRLARDDLDHVVLEIFKLSGAMNSSLRKRCLEDDIYVLNDSNKEELHRQLFGSVN
jgi:hypothetical protein